MRARVKRRPSGLVAQINVTPMVDVMLVLLIIFMVVTPAIVAGFQAQLPEGEHLRERPELAGRVVLGIDVRGGYYLNAMPIDRAAAPDLLARELARHPEQRVLFLKADRRLRYGEIREAMRLARAAGAVMVAAITEQRTGAGAVSTAPEPRAEQ